MARETLALCLVGGHKALVVDAPKLELAVTPTTGHLEGTEADQTASTLQKVSGKPTKGVQHQVARQ